MKKRLLTIKRSALIRIIVWTILFALPYIFSPHDAKKDSTHTATQFFITCTTACWMGLFYLNAGILVPRFLYKKKYVVYFFILVICFCVAVSIFWLLYGVLVPAAPNYFLKGVGWNILPYVFTISISTAYKGIYDRIQADAKATEKQKENLKTELSFLRSQISPHFLFNVLNNIVSLVRFKSDQLEPTVLKLSSLMQYMLYDTDEDKVLMSDEIQYLQSYIDLQQQRFGSKVKVNALLNADDGSAMIEPMLLIPFVENAFKHGIGLIEKPEINIALSTKENVLHFFVQNKFNADNIIDSKDKTSGIGLVNVQRRLELLYGKNQQLIIQKENDLYSVSLEIKLK
jgi:two-component system LytT family sensor kinase